MSNFPERLAELLRETNTKKQDLADAAKVSKRLIDYYLQGAKTPTLDNLISIADFFGVNMDYLIGRSDDPRMFKYDIPHAAGGEDI